MNWSCKSLINNNKLYGASFLEFRIMTNIDQGKALVCIGETIFSVLNGAQVSPAGRYFLFNNSKSRSRRRRRREREKKRSAFVDSWKGIAISHRWKGLRPRPIWTLPTSEDTLPLPPASSPTFLYHEGDQHASWAFLIPWRSWESPADNPITVKELEDVQWGISLRLLGKERFMS